jgi:dCMP deaminase
MDQSKILLKLSVRASIDKTMLAIAEILSARATCRKLAVGAVLIDGHGRIIGTGYNGVPQGYPHCTERPCPGVGQPSGSDSCLAVHAEQNALIQCRQPEEIRTLYVTHAPCLRCTKMMLNTPVVDIVFVHAIPLQDESEKLAVSMRRGWIHYKEEVS